MSLTFKVGQLGDLRIDLARDVARMSAGVTRATLQATTQLRQNLRDDTNAYGMGSGVANAWRGEVFAGKGKSRGGRGGGVRVTPEGATSMNPHGLVWTRAPNIIDSLSTGAVIKAKNADWLALPLPTAGVGPPPAGGGASTRITPEIYERTKGVELVFVPLRHGRYAWLIAYGKLKRGRTYGPRYREGRISRQLVSPFANYGGRLVAVSNNRAKEFGRLQGNTRKVSGVAAIPVFLLLRTVRMPKIFNLELRADEAIANLGVLVTAELADALIGQSGGFEPVRRAA